MAQKVIPYVEDTRNIAVLRLATSQDETVTTTLRYALERGIEAEFQLEDSELSSESLPDSTDHGRMLFTESAEGGAGVLRRLVTEPDALARVAARALGIAHFTADGTDTEAGAARRTLRRRATTVSLLRQSARPHSHRPSCGTRSAAADDPQPNNTELFRREQRPLPSGWLSCARCARPMPNAPSWTRLASNEYRLPDAVHETVGDAHADFVFPQRLRLCRGVRRRTVRRSRTWA